MSTLRQAAQQALEALKFIGQALPWPAGRQAKDAITALRAALAEPDQYAAQNPLGGPAKVFDAMADAIRAGDDYHATLRRYGFAEVKALAEPEQEQEPFILQTDAIGMRRPELRESHQITLTAGTAIYTAPTPRKPLTDEDHEELMRGRSTLDYGRAVEAAHGITGDGA